MIMFIPINFPSVIALDKLGLRMGVTIGIGLTTLGLWVRCFINFNFWFSVAGQIVLAIAQPYMYNAPSILSANWFPKKERIFATSFGAYANILGVAAGCFIPSIFF
jgi:hypothetical protein